MISKVSLALFVVSLIGCGKSNDPRMEKILKSRENRESANGKGIAFGPPTGTIPDGDGSGSGTSSNGGGSDGSGGSNGSGTPGVPGSGGGSSGSIANIGFYCSKDSSKTIGTHMHKATGVSVKLFNAGGIIVAEDGDVSRAQSRRTSIMTSKTAELNFGSVPDGVYYVAFCDVAQHAVCNIPPDRRADPIDKDDGKYSKAIVGFADNVSISNNKVIAVGKTDVLFPMPQTKAEEELCSDIDSPLIIDLAGDGIALSSIASGVSFDIDGNGKSNHTAWTIDADDAFLAIDLNANGAIDSGAELFGNHSIGPDGQKSANGFLSLAKYDSNRDGRIDSSDAVFFKLRLWADRNHNGISEADELSDLEALGIVSIGLDYVEMLEKDQHGNEVRQRSLVKFKDKERVIVDAWLRRF